MNKSSSFTRRLRVTSPDIELEEECRHLKETEKHLNVRFRDFDHDTQLPVGYSVSSMADLQMRIEKLGELICSSPEGLQKRLLEAERKLEEVAAIQISQLDILGSFKNCLSRLDKLEQQLLCSSQVCLESHSQQELRLRKLEQHMGQEVDPALAMSSHRIQKLEQAEMDRVADYLDLEQRLSRTFRSNLDELVSSRLEQLKQTWRLAHLVDFPELPAGKAEQSQEARPSQAQSAHMDSRSILVYNGDERVNGIYSPVRPGSKSGKSPIPAFVPGAAVGPLIWRKQGEDRLHITNTEGAWWITEDTGSLSTDLYRTPKDAGLFTGRVNDPCSAPVDVPWVACAGGTETGAAPKTKWAVQPFRLSQVPSLQS
mmetsp:Transcript_23224/g.41943  ORF Transcript_23224/g.41943 Transcript_23224/m.41943 type:complete len:370 (-) Transcript_23224:3-1112(-)